MLTYADKSEQKFINEKIPEFIDPEYRDAFYAETLKGTVSIDDKKAISSIQANNDALIVRYFYNELSSMFQQHAKIIRSGNISHGNSMLLEKSKKIWTNLKTILHPLSEKLLKQFNNIELYLLSTCYQQTHRLWDPFDDTILLEQFQQMKKEPSFDAQNNLLKIMILQKALLIRKKLDAEENIFDMLYKYQETHYADKQKYGEIILQEISQEMKFTSMKSSNRLTILDDNNVRKYFSQDLSFLLNLINDGKNPLGTEAVMNFIINLLQEFMTEKDGLLSLKTVIPIDDVADMIFQYADIYACTYTLKQAQQVFDQLLLTIATIDQQDIFFLEWIFKEYYKNPSYQYQHSFTRLLRTLFQNTENFKTMGNNYGPELSKYIGYYSQEEKINITDSKSFDDAKTLTATLNALHRNNNNLLNSIVEKGELENYLTLLKKIIMKANLKEVILKEKEIIAIFNLLPRNRNLSYPILLENLFQALLICLNQKQAVDFIKNLNLSKLDDTVLIAFLQVIKKSGDPKIRAALLKEIFNQENDIPFLKDKLSKLSLQEIRSLLVCTTNNPTLKELENYMKTLKNPLRMIQACQAPWILSSHKEKKDTTETTRSLISLIESVQKDHDKNRKIYSFLETKSQLVEILMRIKEKLDDKPIFHDDFWSFFQTTNAKAHDLIESSLKPKP